MTGSGRTSAGIPLRDVCWCALPEYSRVAHQIDVVGKNERCVLDNHSKNKSVEQDEEQRSKAADASLVTTKPQGLEVQVLAGPRECMERARLYQHKLALGERRNCRSTSDATRMQSLA